MASSGNRPRRSGRPPARKSGAGAPKKAGGGRSGKSPSGSRAKAPAKKTPVVFDQRPDVIEEEPRLFRLGIVPGATVGRWVDTWKQRMPHVGIEIVELSAQTQEQSFADDVIDAALVRLPLTDAGLQVIPLYEELPVVVASVESHLMAAEELDIADLAGEVVLTTHEDVLGPLDLPGTRASTVPPLNTTQDAIATVAAGVGIVVVPMSLARLHHRKDAGYRVLRGGPVAPVGFAWPAARTTADVETFIGIIRGRTANSSR